MRVPFTLNVKEGCNTLAYVYQSNWGMGRTEEEKSLRAGSASGYNLGDFDPCLLVPAAPPVARATRSMKGTELPGDAYNRTQGADPAGHAIGILTGAGFTVERTNANGQIDHLRGSGRQGPSQPQSTRTEARPPLAARRICPRQPLARPGSPSTPSGFTLSSSMVATSRLPPRNYRPRAMVTQASSTTGPS